MAEIKIEDMVFSNTYMQIFDLLDDCILITDKDSKLVFMNKASEELDRLKRDDAIGKEYTDLYKVNTYSSATLKCLATGDVVKDMYQDYITVRGDNIITMSNAYPLMKDGVMEGVFTVTKDITKYKETMKIYKGYLKENEKNDSEKGYAENIAPYDFDDIVGVSDEIKSTKEMAKMAAGTNANIVIYGETGTGKELYAQSIHNASDAKGDFVSINCAAIPENLLESMLFGTVKGAFTGAVDKIGLFEEAHNGTLLLDELNSMPIDLQAKILRAVETNRIRRVGENKERNINTRIIATTNVHPFEAIEEGTIRRDLYYRLGVITIKIPPLRERLEDIEVLTDYFIKKFNNKYDKNVLGISDEVKEVFTSFEWKGNVRELQHNLEQSMIMVGDKEYITYQDLPVFIREISEHGTLANNSEKLYSGRIDINNEDQDIDSILNTIESNLIEDRLEKNDYNISRTAEELGLSRQTLDYRIKKHNISKQ